MSLCYYCTFVAKFFHKMKLGSAIFWSAAIFFGVKLFAKGSGYAHFYEKMNYYIKARIHRVTLSGITVKANIEIHNPTDVKISITKPVVRAYSNNIEIGHSSPENVKIDILPNAVTQIPTIDLVLPWSVELGKIVAQAGTSVMELIQSGSIDAIGVNVVIKSLFNVDGIKSITQTNNVEL